MSPGIISSRSLLDDMTQLRRDAAKPSNQVSTSSSASSTAVSSSQPSPILRPADGKPPIPDIKMTTADNTAVPPTVNAELVDEVRRVLASSDDQNRRLDQFLTKWETACKAPSFVRAYSEGYIRPLNSKNSGARVSKVNSPREASQQTRSQTPRPVTVEDCSDEDDDKTRRKPAPGPVRKSAATASTVPTSPVTASTPAPAPPPMKEVRFSDRPTVQRSSSSGYFPRYGTVQPPLHQSREITPSPLDKKWGVLFTGKREPTRRLADVLRGLALHLTEVYKPSYSLVLTPEKLHRFYCRYRLENDFTQLAQIFSLQSREAMRSLEILYLNLQLDYHLVQDCSSSRKDRAWIPALTPEGFVQWVINMIRAFPEQEAARLGHIISDLPLEAVPYDPVLESCPRERLPRQISRHLFPSQPNEDMQQLVKQSIARFWKTSAGGGVDKLPLLSLPPSPSWTYTIQNPLAPLTTPPLIHSDAKSREEHLIHSRRDRDGDTFIEVAPAKRSSLSSRRKSDGADDRSSRHSMSYIRPKSPSRRSKHYDREAREPERDRHRPDRRECRWMADGSEGGRHRRRDGKRTRS